MTTNHVCARCAYALRGLPVTSQCPECGFAIADSLKGHLLEHSSPEYVAKLNSGLALILNGLLTYIVLSVALLIVSFAGVLPYRVNASLSGLASLGIALVILAGYFRVSEPDPKFTGDDSLSGVATLLRAAVIVQIAATLASFVLNLDRSAMVFGSVVMVVLWILGLIKLAAWITQFIAMMNYVRWLASRIPDAFMKARAARYRWLLPTIAVLGLPLIGLGPLIALVMYWNLLDRLRKHTRSILKYGKPEPLPGLSAA